MLYLIVKSILGAVGHILFRVRVRGVSNVPAEGPVIICANHVSWWDPVLMAFALKRPVHYMAKRELFRNPVLGYLFRKIHAFPVNRGKADLGAIKAGITILRNGEMLGIFPEGTRQKAGNQLGEMHAGAALFGVKTGAPVVPAAIRSTFRIGQPVVIVFGESFTLGAPTSRSASDVDDGAKVIGKAISDLWEGIREESGAVARQVRSC